MSPATPAVTSGKRAVSENTKREPKRSTSEPDAYAERIPARYAARHGAPKPCGIMAWSAWEAVVAFKVVLKR